MTTNEVDITPDLDGGILKTIIKNGEGISTPTNGCKVTVHYVGKLPDGTVFDSSRERDQPFEFNLGTGEVIKAWDIGVATMRKGELATFVCKPEYAYGAAGSPPKIPPNATLIFEVEMISWKAEDLSPKKDGGILRTIIQVGEGFSSPSDGSTVDIHVTGEYNGQVFDDRDVIFPLGEGSEYGICEGVEKALESFKIKEKSKLQIKSKYAFGSAGKPEYNIPPNADVEYTIRLNNFEKLKEFWTLDPPEKITQATFFKEKGTKYFKENKFALAAKFYEKMNDYIGTTLGFSETEEATAKELKKAMSLNLALCYLKLDKPVEARHECDKVLEIEPNNEKALFRRGQSYLNTAESELALKDFEQVLKIDPKNTAAARNLLQCKEVLKKQRSQEKKIYANMFEKFAKHDKEKQNWVYGWWDGKDVQTDKYVPPETDKEELLQRKKEREALLKELEKKKLQMQKERERLEAEKAKDSREFPKLENVSTESSEQSEADKESVLTHDDALPIVSESTSQCNE